MSNGESVFDQPVKNSLKTYDNIWKLATDQGDDYAKCWLLDYVYFKHYYKVIAIDLIKQQARDANPKPLQQINLTGNLDRDGNTTVFFITVFITVFFSFFQFFYYDVDIKLLNIN